MGRGMKRKHGRHGRSGQKVTKRRFQQRRPFKKMRRRHDEVQDDSGHTHPTKRPSDEKLKKTASVLSEDEDSSSCEVEEGEVESNCYMDLLCTLGVKDMENDDNSDVDGESSADDVEEETNGVEDTSSEEDSADELNSAVDGDDDDSRKSVHDEASDDADSKIGDKLDAENDNDIETAEGSEPESDSDADEVVAKGDDPFVCHFETLIPDDVAGKIVSKQASLCHELIAVANIGKLDVSFWSDVNQPKFKSTECAARKQCVKQSLCNQLAAANIKSAHVELSAGDQWTALQRSVFACINSYRDFYYPERTHGTGEELRLVYCLHALNHVLKTRSRIMSHNSKIKNKHDEIPDEYRDKGFTRPKVVILLPFRDSALRVVNIMTELVADKQSFVSARSRFLSEYSKREDDEPTPSNISEDWEAIFSGNTHECFSIGLGIAKKTLKLYTKFDDSDIILASPLGLWGLTQAKKEGDAVGDCDFLSSVEILIIDQADVLLMQNWDHVLSLFDRVNRMPTNPTDIDFSRVRMWTLNGWSKLYRQTIFFSQFDVLQLQSTFKSCCSNYAGRMIVRSSPPGVWCQIFVQCRHEYYRFDVDEAKFADDKRFNFFSSLLSGYSDDAMKKTLLFVSSSLDFIRIRNHLMRNQVHFVTLSEYDEPDMVKRNRSRFVNDDRIQFALMTERFLFYRRVEFQKLTGIKHLLFYDLPTRPQFYADIFNWLRDHRPQYKSNEENATCRVLYCKYDLHRLRNVAGSSRGEMIHRYLVVDRTKNRLSCDPPILEAA